MEIKYIPLLKLLLEAEDRVTSRNLAINLSLSVRTVKTYILELNKLYPGLISSSSKGYLIDYDLAKKLLRENRSGIPQTAHERAVYVVLKIINSHEKICELDLCEELFISYSTFRHLIPNIKKMLAPYDLNLENNSSFLSITGNEKNIRRFLSGIFHQEYSNNFFNLNLMQDVYPDIDIDYIKEVITDKLSQKQYFISDYSLINLVLHITIMLDRINNNYSDSFNFLSHVEIKKEEYDLCSDIISEIESHFDLDFNPAEYSDLLYQILSQITYLDHRKISLNELNTLVGNDCVDLVQKMVHYISEYYDINLEDTDFIIRFSLHIKNLLMRSGNKHFNKNPLTENIKANCPLIYDNSVAISGMIKEQTGIIINDDEIAYIAFHIGNALENIINAQPKINCIIYFPSYYSTNFHFYQKLMHKFGNEITITNIVTNDEEFDSIPTCDLLILTAPTEYISQIPKVEIQPFLTTNNIKLLEEKIHLIKEEKKRNDFSNSLRQIFQPELFEHSGEQFKKGTLIHYLCQKLISLGYIDDSFEENVLNRESLSSTGYENFAIPHSIKMDAKKTGMFVFISDYPIQWDEKHSVTLIILLFFNSSQRAVFNDIYDSLTTFLTNRINCQAISSIYSYEEFIEYVSNHIDV